jgi:hypothetical protein
MLSFLDMKVHAVGAGLRWFGLALGFAYFGLIFATVFAAPTSFILLFGQSDVEIPVTLEPPLEVELAGGRIVVLGEERTTEYRGFGGREEEAIPNRVSVRAQVPVQKGDRDTRIALGAALVATLAVAWIGLTALRRFVRAAREGEPFDRANLRRLRLVAAAVTAWPVITGVTLAVLESTIEAVPGASARAPGPDWKISLLVGLGLFALAEVWRVGVELRELEEATV